MNDALFHSIAKKANNELPFIDTVTLSGFGEFSMDPNWQQKVAIGSQHFKTVHIVTNASLLTEEDLDFLLENVSDIRISLYGLDESTYRLIHNPPAQIKFAKVKQNIEYFSRYKKKGQRVILNYIEVLSNRRQTHEWIRFWKDRVDLVEVWKPHNWIDAKEYRSIDRRRRITCGRPFNGPIQVQVDGTVNVCCFDYNGLMIIGDLNTQSFEEIYHGKEMEKIQKYHKSGKADKLYLCAICDQRNTDESKAKNIIYNSGYDIFSRIRRTSTDYDEL